MGQPEIVKSNMIKPGIVVIDVGTNRVENTTRKKVIVGDVDFEEASKMASYITPVPYGVGPMTIIMLMRNTIISAKRTLETRSL